MPYGWVVRGDSKIKTIYDIKNMKGVRVPLDTAATSLVTTPKEALPAFLDMNPQDLTFVTYGSYTPYVQSIADGKADVAFVSPQSAVTYEIEANPQGIRWLDMPAEDKAGWARWLKVNPTQSPGLWTWGVKTAIGHYGCILPHSYWTTADVDEELIYQLAKWFHKNYDAYKDGYVSCARMHIDVFRDYLSHSPFPLHTGTIRYLKEIGKWTAEDDAWNKSAIELMTKYVTAWKNATAEAKAKGIEINSGNKAWVDLWAGYIKSIPRFTTRL